MWGAAQWGSRAIDLRRTPSAQRPVFEVDTRPSQWEQSRGVFPAGAFVPLRSVATGCLSRAVGWDSVRLRRVGVHIGQRNPLERLAFLRIGFTAFECKTFCFFLKTILVRGARRLLELSCPYALGQTGLK